MGVLTQYETDIGGLDSALVNKIGTTTLTTAAQNLSGAVNELDAELGNETLPDPSKTVKGNINSIKQSLSDLRTVKTATATLTTNSNGVLTIPTTVCKPSTQNLLAVWAGAGAYGYFRLDSIANDYYAVCIVNLAGGSTITKVASTSVTIGYAYIDLT